MKQSSRLLNILENLAVPMALVAQLALADQAAAADPLVLDRGANFRVVQTEEGATYTEMATGMHYWNGQWQESREEIELLPQGGAIARQGQHIVAFNTVINAEVAVELVTSDNKRFRSRILGLAYVDVVSGQSTLIAVLKESVGEVAGNVVVYPDAFDGEGISADVRFTYTRYGFEQDVILRKNPPPPEDFGIEAKNARIQIWTAFTEPPQPRKKQIVLRQEADPAVRQAMAHPDFTDEFLEFGAIQIGQGKAFAIENEAVPPEGMSTVPVGKEWVAGDGMAFLVETVEYATIKPLLDTLPRDMAAIQPKTPNRQTAALKSKSASSPGELAKLFAASRTNPLITAAPQMQLAQATRPKRPGVVLDYATLNVDTNNYTFAAQTYYVSGPVQLGGTNTLMPGAVIKFATNTANASLKITGSGAKLNCLATPFRPAVLTGKDDNSAGENISGSNANPNGMYAVYALRFDYSSSGVLASVSNLCIRYAQYGLSFYYGTNHVASHIQFYRCENAVELNFSDVNLRNVLGYGGSSSSSFINSFYQPTVRCENCGINSYYNLNSGSHATVYLTNCMLYSIGTISSYSGVNNFTNTGSPYQPVGAGAYYYAPNSAYRNAGTTNINPQLLAELRQRTTYPPVLLTNAFISDTILAPEAPRDTDDVDIGYHYPAMDFLLNNLAATNCTITMTNGVVVGIYGSTGLKFQTGSKLYSEGTPTSPNRILQCTMIQERSSTSYDGSSGAITLKDDTANVGSTLPELRLRFTELPTMAGWGIHFSGGSKLGILVIKDSQFLGGQITWNTNGVAGRLIALTNNLFEAVTNTFGTGGDPVTIIARNNLFKDGILTLKPVTTNDWSWSDNHFDGVSLTQNTNSITNSYNAYVNATRITPTNTHDVTLTSFTYATGALGTYYHSSTNLLDAGSQNATNAGLYHFTVLASQAKETNSTVDIGFHYVAVDTNGVPFDSDGDGLADYYEDKNGNGSQEVDETAWVSGRSDTDGDGVSDYWEIFLGRNPLAAGTTNDFNGSLNLRIYTPLK
jgi:hypothetical protein